MRFFVIFRMQGAFPSGQDSEAFELPEANWDALKADLKLKRQQCQNCQNLESRNKKDLVCCPYPLSNITMIGCKAFKDVLLQ